MLAAKQIENLFSELNEKLKEKNELGEVGLAGGAVMCLVYNARASTKDVDAIFKPTQIIRKLSAKIGEEHGLASDWLNDAAKGYLQGAFEKQDVLVFSNLRVWAPEPQYMLTMKCLSARWDTHDREDVIFLIKFLQIKNAKSVFHILEKFYPKGKIPPKTQYLIEELFEKN